MLCKEEASAADVAAPGGIQLLGSVRLYRNIHNLIRTLGKVSLIKCVLFVENSTKGAGGVQSFYKS